VGDEHASFDKSPRIEQGFDPFPRSHFPFGTLGSRTLEAAALGGLVTKLLQAFNRRMAHTQVPVSSKFLYAALRRRVGGDVISAMFYKQETPAVRESYAGSIVF